MDKTFAIEALNLTKYYGETLAVDQVNFEVRRGEIFGFLGPNGAGKTTTIRMLSGLSQPSAGAIRVLGYDIGSEIVEAKKGFGVVPEYSNLYGELTAQDNLIFAAQLYGVPRQQRIRRAEELLETFGLLEKKDAHFATLSKGMKRSLTIAAALIHNPQLIFLDEPTVALDVVNARSLRSLVRELNRRGVTVFLTTHYLEEAAMLCDRIAILLQGRIIVIDTPDNLKQRVKAEHACEVRFAPMPTGVMELEGLESVYRVERSGAGFRLYGESMPDIVQAVFTYASQKGLEIVFISTTSPTLEDAFVQLTGIAPEVMLVEKGVK